MYGNAHNFDKRHEVCPCSSCQLQHHSGNTDSNVKMCSLTVPPEAMFATGRGKTSSMPRGLAVRHRGRTGFFFRQKNRGTVLPRK